MSSSLSSLPEHTNTVDQRAIRRANLSAVLRRVATEGPRSRATLAVETGFTKSTTSSLVGELIERGLVVATDEHERPGRVGRPGRTVRLDGDAIAAVGLEVNVDYLAVCVLDLGGRTRYQRRVEADNAGSSPARVLGRVTRLARDAIATVEEEGARVVGAALAVPGLVDAAGELLIVAPNLGWQRVRCGRELRRRLDRPDLTILVDNEANLAALAEHWEGAASDLRDVVVLSGTVGIGAGMLVDGRLFRGRHGFAGELGHVTVDPDGARCACGARGCLETVAGKAGLLRAAGIPRRDLRELLARAHRGDARTLATLATAGQALGIALADSVSLLDPQAVVLGGYLTAFSDWLLGPLHTELTTRVLGAETRACELRVGLLADRAAVRGAAASILSAVLADPMLVGARYRADSSSSISS
jgi:predicted NBD/HSP70 family sugar kinase